MSSITEGNAAQYSTSDRLAARARLHQAYSVADEPWFPWVGRHLDLAPGQRVLDIGCGPGWFWAANPPERLEGLHLTLADQSQGMVDEAVQRCRSLPFAEVDGEVADARALPFADDSFDTVVAMHMLYHVADQPGAIAEMYRVLKPGGQLAVTTNDRDNLAALYSLTAAFGGGSDDPAGVAFGFTRAQALLADRFGAVESHEHPSRLRITEPLDVFLALTSYPPGDSAGPVQLDAFRAAIDAAFATGGGVLEAKKRVGLFLTRKS